MYVKIGDGDRVEEVRFEGDGCTISQAGGSIVTELAEGLTLDEVKALGLSEINEEMGEEVVKSRVRCATLALGTCRRQSTSSAATEIAATPVCRPSK
jgi:nitrogen fixation NifU-like protein